MVKLRPEIVELLERAQRAVEDAERLCAERHWLAAIAEQRRYIVNASVLRSQTEK